MGRPSAEESLGHWGLPNVPTLRLAAVWLWASCLAFLSQHLSSGKKKSPAPCPGEARHTAAATVAAHLVVSDDSCRCQRDMMCRDDPDPRPMWRQPGGGGGAEAGSLASLPS